jgi:hypothetical protein
MADTINLAYFREGKLDKAILKFTYDNTKGEPKDALRVARIVKGDNSSLLVFAQGTQDYNVCYRFFLYDVVFGEGSTYSRTRTIDLS